jgi:hypothetical protein
MTSITRRAAIGLLGAGGALLGLGLAGGYLLRDALKSIAGGGMMGTGMMGSATQAEIPQLYEPLRSPHRDKTNGRGDPMVAYAPQLSPMLQT